MANILAARASIHVTQETNTFELAPISQRQLDFNSTYPHRRLPRPRRRFLPGEYIQTYISPYDSNTILNGTVPLADSTSREFRRRIRRFVDLFSVSSPTFLESWYIRIRRACIRIERASLRTRRFQSRFCPGYCRLARLPYTRPYIFPNHFEPILAPSPVPYQNFPVSADTRTARGG